MTLNLTQIKIQNCRNIKSAEIFPAEKLNVIYGSNGSGKTNLLETIYYLGNVASFRTINIKKIISSKEKEMILFSEVNDQNENKKIGIRRNDKEVEIKISGNPINKKSDLTKILPIKIINPESHRLLELGPKFRRNFIDWGVFHVEHNFLEKWKNFYRILKQRNSALKHHRNKKEVEIWNASFIETAHSLDKYRKIYLENLSHELKILSQSFFGIVDINISYSAGWNIGSELSDELDKSLSKDIEIGFTQIGPHRADFSIRMNGHLTKDYVSRGQQKLLIILLILSQASYLKIKDGKGCIILVDDLPSELDTNNREIFINLLENIGYQTFITGTDLKLFEKSLNTISKLFHVEHGIVKLG